MQANRLKALPGMGSIAAVAGVVFLMIADLAACGAEPLELQSPAASRKASTTTGVVAQGICEGNATSPCDGDGEPDPEPGPRTLKPTCPMMWECESTSSYYATSSACRADPACDGTCYRDYKCSKNCYCP